MSDYCDIVELGNKIQTDMSKLKKLQRDLEVFVNSFEGDQKMATNTDKEEKAINYWRNVLNTTKSHYDSSVAYGNTAKAQIEAKLMRNKEYAMSQLEAAKQKYERAIEAALKEFNDANAVVEKQLEQSLQTFETQTLSQGARLQEAEANLKRKIQKKKPKRQLELEKEIADLEAALQRNKERYSTASQRSAI